MELFLDDCLMIGPRMPQKGTERAMSRTWMFMDGDGDNMNVGMVLFQVVISFAASPVVVHTSSK